MRDYITTSSIASVMDLMKSSVITTSTAVLYSRLGTTSATSLAIFFVIVSLNV